MSTVEISISENQVPSLLGGTISGYKFNQRPYAHPGDPVVFFIGWHNPVLSATVLRMWYDESDKYTPWNISFAGVQQYLDKVE